MGKLYVAVAATGLLLALAPSAQAGGGHGRTPGQAFTPPGFSNIDTSKHTNWGTNTQTTVQPPGWSHNTTGQSHGWNSSLVPPGLNSPPGRR